MLWGFIGFPLQNTAVEDSSPELIWKEKKGELEGFPEK
jgi:hypothetical protein